MPNFVYYPPTTPYLDILYQDDDIVVLNKPYGLLSVPGRAKKNRDSLALRILRVWPNASVVHRLDMATSGLLILTMRKSAQSHIGRQFQQKIIDKTYYARVEGIIKEDNGVIDLPIRCDWENRPRQIVDFAEGKSSQTEWSVVKREKLTTLVCLKPLTGRTHQLRVHLQAIGHAIVGDEFYSTEFGKKLSPQRLALHAASITLTHPSTQQRITFNCPPPFMNI
ncbi:ribosomal large subunit pseudouridine synthase A [Psychromonas ingrahamii 37]|uniref:Dual-specificity RNA pseudouridine synthase RluA n=1 Tax=Psychromonas ingrahamii (strain DSM 17664 / CCUG 51855 / 37) TaxID=357804 RepID=A1SSF6_PSYIN|nr:pseudouridine synthase [Psychromonas ingrahamii]ABM02421.1 ribosomal large subunit pseudouridine synthase A [Psychromonas ingrahamii 37]